MDKLHGNVFRVRVKLGGARRWIRRCDSKLLTLIYTFRKRCRYSRGCNAIRPLTPFALMWIDWPLVNQSMINLNYSVLSGLNSYWSRHLVSIDETNLPSVQLVNEIETVFTTMKKEGNFFLFFFFLTCLINLPSTNITNIASLPSRPVVQLKNI